MSKEQYLRENYPDVLNLSHIGLEKAKEIIAGISAYVEDSCKDLTTHQLRQMFAEVKGARDVIQLQLARPKIAYLGARQEKESVKKIVALIDFMIENTGEDQLDEFKNFMEAIVAYHKYHFGNKNQ